MEGAGFLNPGTAGFMGNSIVTLAPGLRFDLGRHAELGCCYQSPVSNSKQSLSGDRLIAGLILRYGSVTARPPARPARVAAGRDHGLGHVTFWWVTPRRPGVTRRRFRVAPRASRRSADHE